MNGLIENYRRSLTCGWRDGCGLVRMSPHSYYVGDSWVGVVLILTEEGIVMIDSGITGQMWMIFEAIRRLGYDPERDIKLCLLSHAHCDHCSGMALLQNYAKPLVYMSEQEKDWPGKKPCYAGLPETLDPVIPFAADRFYDGSPVVHGGLTIETVHTPGHSPGTTSFFFRDTADDGTIYRVGLHGGLGLNTLEDSFFESIGQARKAREIYKQSQQALLELPVDITISNHGGNIALMDKRGLDPMDYSRFVDPGLWRSHIAAKLRQLEKRY